MPNIYLNEQNVDDLGRMLMELLSEVWIMRDRMALMERLYGDKLGVSAKELDDFVPTPRMAEELEALRDRMVRNVLGAPVVAAQARTVDATLARADLTRP